MKRNISSDKTLNSESAFGRIELFGGIISMAILVCLCAPALARTRPRSELVVCANNLRQISTAWRMWASDHGDQWPWLVPVVPRGSQNQPIAWQHFQVVSNELRTPSILACPSDNRKPANHFLNSNGGLPWPIQQNNAVSYFVGLDALFDQPISLLTGDRHFAGSSNPRANCARMPLAGAIAYELNSLDASEGRLRWTNSIHGTDVGNAAVGDGSVVVKTSASFREMVVRWQGDGNINNHILPPY